MCRPCFCTLLPGHRGRDRTRAGVDETVVCRRVKDENESLVQERDNLVKDHGGCSKEISNYKDELEDLKAELQEVALVLLPAFTVLLVPLCCVY